ncbi:MAG: ribosome maturation factor RimM [Gammaproteobacteria bacterium]|nr:ribosome maturation factor RimM [Gammaproteobacteria bacterium]
MSNYLIVGRFGSAYGTQGWIKVYSFTHPAENILTYADWFIESGNAWTQLKLEKRSVLGKNILVKISGFDTPETVKRYTNFNIAVTRDSLPKLNPNEYYWADLQGLHVINQEGIDLGVVSEFLATGANDVMVVIGEKRRLIPYINDVVREVRLEKKIILVDWGVDY